MVDDGMITPLRRDAFQSTVVQNTGQMGGPSKSNKTDDQARKGTVIAFKVVHVLVIILALWSLAVHALGVFFFTRGFLLTRLVLSNKSECTVLPVVDEPPYTIVSEQEGCWHPKTFEKAVVILIDALRYDFTVPFQSTPEASNASFFHNAFPVLYETARTTPGNAFLLPFIADPPTTTLQRLKGLTTGTLPTFIDAGSNFAGTAIEEDSLLTQLKDAGKTLVHLGDDTWNSLFPGYFDADLSRPYDSFNVWDLHTVDNGVVEHLLPLLQPTNSTKWDVIFAHFLGVDHAGHRYGPDHSAMADKLMQMNRVVKDIVELIDDETLLVVMGDHGMDTKGDHGGESDDEVESALWMYSKKKTFGRTQPAFMQPPKTAKERQVRQIDLVPTLSLLLGLPVPFNNLGAPIEEAFAGSDGNDWTNLALVNRLTSNQIRRYQTEYSRAKDFHGTNLQQGLELGMLESSELLRTSSNAAFVQWKKIYEAYREYQTETLIMYRGLWANFNIPSMIHGLEILGAGLAFLLVYVRSFQGDKANMAPPFLRSVGLGSAGGAILGLTFGAVTKQSTIIASALYGTAIGGVIGSYLTFFQLRRQLVWPLPTSLWSWLALIFTLSQAIGFASNSYTIHEASILQFFLTSFGVLSCISSLRQSSSSDRILGSYHSLLFTVLTRVASISRLCREEQMPGCRSTFYASSSSSTSAPWQLYIPYAIAVLLPEVIKAFYKGTASYEGSAGFWIGFCFRIGLLLVAAVWTIDAADNASWFADSVSSETLRTTSITLARCVLAIALAAGATTFIWAKPCVRISVLSPSEQQAVTSQNQQAISEKDSSSASLSTSPSNARPQVMILGYANVHGTRYFLLLPVFILTISLLLPPMGQFAIAICSWQILCLLEILDTNGLTINSSTSPSLSLQNPNSAIGPVVLAMLGSYHFFKTGHQAVLSSIQWNAAFLPLRTVQYPWSPLLITLNTFGAQILCAVAVPLTVLWKRPISKGSSGLRPILDDVAHAMFTHMLYYATIQLATTMWAAHLRRHLMLYRVFMPRFLMSSVVLVIVDLTLIFVAWMGVGVSATSVGEVFGY